KKIKPDLLILDLIMPELTGVDVLDQLREAGLLNGFMPVLMLTASNSTEAKQQSLAAGASDFLSKPFDLLEAKLRIKNLLFSTFLLGELRQQNQSLEERVAQRTGQLARQNAILKDIAWTQSHVFRAPLARILGVVSLLQE
ncbi:response regulator, partial [Arthrospira platensis SPKY1]|nr:response regulator [Arthrospira platensis SPKY1]